MIGRRELLKYSASGVAASLLSSVPSVAASSPIITRPIPSTGEMLPVVGLGSSATFANEARRQEMDGLREVMRTFVDNGGKVFDTAPSYGSEQAAGQIANELGVASRIFWATKVNVAPRGGSADPGAARAQIEASFNMFKVPKLDLIQVHNVADVATQLGVLKELKRQGRVRYIGVTSTSPQQYPELVQVMRNEPIDFIGVDYAVDNRLSEQEVLPLALERKIGTLIYLPFGRTRLFTRVKGVELPAWAAEFDAKTWAQFFLKFLIGHPAVTVVTPATSNPKNMLDNLGGAIGRLPSEAQRKMMVEFIEALPRA